MAGKFDKSALIEFFLIEAEDHIQNLTNGLLAIEKAPENRDVLDELFRTAHTLKGSAAMMGYSVVSEIAHRMEDALSQVRSGEHPADTKIVNFALETLDSIKLVIQDITQRKEEDPRLAGRVNARFQEFFHGGPPAEPVPVQSAAPPSTPAAAEPVSVPLPPKAPPVVPAPAASAAQTAVPSELAPSATPLTLKTSIEEAKKQGIVEKREWGKRATDVSEIEKQVIRVNINQLNTLMNLVGELVIKRNHLERQLHFVQAVKEQLSFSQARLLKTVRGFEEKYEFSLPAPAPLPAARPESGSFTGDFFDMEFDRYDDFNLLSRQLVEITNDLNEVMNEFNSFFDGFDEETSHISMITNRLQEEITAARMVELDRLFLRFSRPVRDLAQAEGKAVSIIIAGGETKIDKTVFEMISDPLMHLVRNAVSHGIEPREERIRRGKEPTGTAILRARHEGNSIIVEVEDDGRGIDPELLRTEAVRRGFLSPAAAKELSDSEAINLIFLPGFTTRREVSELSGRGVGMDVVNTDIAKVNGRIEVQTELGVGTKFSIKLPLTLAISQALVVRCGGSEFAIPLATVEETTRFTLRDIQKVAGEEVVNLRGKFLPLIRLENHFGMQPLQPPDRYTKYPTLILGVLEKRVGLMVEEIVGREDIVVKQMGDFLRDVRTFSGASVSGEGTVRLIIDTFNLVGQQGIAEKAKATFIRGESAAAALEAMTPAGAIALADQAPSGPPSVLVVDDSISIRKYVSHVLERVGFKVEVAVHGLEALEKMSGRKFNLIITDLEMPVMHGYELIAELKRSPKTAKLPVVVLTSRAGEKHRQKALEMGAQDYIVKPFDEQTLIDITRRLTQTVAA